MQKRRNGRHPDIYMSVREETETKKTDYSRTTQQITTGFSCAYTLLLNNISRQQACKGLFGNKNVFWYGGGM